MSQNASMKAGSKVNRTARLRATRPSSRRPAARSGQWWSVRTAIVASKLASANGSASADAAIAGAASGGALGAHHRGRLDRHDLAVARLVGARAGADVQHRARVPSAAWMRARSRGSSPRVDAYVRPIVS